MLAIILSLTISILFNMFFMYSRSRQRKSIERLKELTIEDQLTGIYNRRYFDTYMPKILSMSISKNYSTQLMMIDIDNFKSINDTYGHVFGDYVIKEIASEINHITREEDLFVRYGGEEFALVLGDTFKADAKIIADRILSKIENSIYKFKGERVSVTLSIGISEYDYTDTINQFVAKSDEALYQAKKTGKNKYTFY